jgi:hypothetical protein
LPHGLYQDEEEAEAAGVEVAVASVMSAASKETAVGSAAPVCRLEKSSAAAAPDRQTQVTRLGLIRRETSGCDEKSVCIRPIHGGQDDLLNVHSPSVRQAVNCRRGGYAVTSVHIWRVELEGSWAGKGGQGGLELPRDACGFAGWVCG